MEKALLKTWGVAIILFAVVLCLGVAMIFARPTEYYEYQGETTSMMQSGISNGGLLQLGRMWIEYPNYFAIGAGVSAVGIIGMGFSIQNMYRERDRVINDALQSKSEGMKDIMRGNIWRNRN